MIESSISRRYAKALVELARENNTLDQTLAQLTSIVTAAELSDSQLLHVLGNRFLDLSARLRVVDELAAKLQLDVSVKNFIKILIQKGRIPFLPNILESFRGYVFELQNKVEVDLTSARPLKDLVVKEIQEKMAALLKKQVVVKSQVNPQVLGGVSVRVGDQIFDGTLLAQIQKMGSEMKKQIGWN